jgi:hypothetical protein
VEIQTFFRAHRRTLGRYLLVAAPALALWLLFLITGLRGADFGFHWDELESHVDPTRKMVASGVLVPRIYTYPMLTKWLILLPALPSAIGPYLSGGDPAGMQSAMLATMNAPTYLLTLRQLFIVISSTTVLWVYAGALLLGHRPWQALLAASGIGLSWEFAYHARFVVPDCLVATFSSLALVALAAFFRTKRSVYLYGAAVVAGLATGTKYPGVFLLLPVLLAGALTLPRRAIFAHAFRLAALSGLAFAVYLVTTPATVIDPFEFIRGTRFISNYYATMKHGGYTVESAWVHTKLVLQYLSLAFFSAYLPLAIGLFVASLAGADLREVLPPDVSRAMQQALGFFDRIMPGYASDVGLLVGPESRGSSPVRIPRDDASRVSASTPGLYPVGEGAGYAGGIMSAAIDGLRSAAALVGAFAPAG